MSLSSPVPVLRILHEADARSFYVDQLHFVVDWAHRFGEGYPIYLQLRRGACVLHLTAHSGDAAPGGHVRIGAEDLDALQAELAGRGLAVVVKDQPWGTRELRLTDPSGNLLVFFAPA